jgi:integrase
MAVFKRGGIFWYEFTLNGERYRKSTKQGNKRTATDLEAAHRTAILRGEVGIGKRVKAPTVAEFAEKFEAHIRMVCAEKPRTIEFYLGRVRQIVAGPLAGLRLSDIDEGAIEAHKQLRRGSISSHGKPLSPASVNRELAVIRRFMRLAQEWKVIDRVPRIRMLRGERIREFVPSIQQERLYLSVAPEPLRSIAIVLIGTGLRMNELLTLDWRDVQLSPPRERNSGI